MTPDESPDTNSDSRSARSPVVRFLRALGPAIIVASVVLGPGSILSSSKVGAEYGFGMVWVLLLAAGLMMGLVALCGRLGVALRGTMCEELAARVGRPLAVCVGLSIFLVCAGFQFGNNLGVLAALEPWLPATSGQAQDGGMFGKLLTLPNLLLLGLNAAILAFVFGSKRLYKPVERLMMVLVAMMIFGFFGNFFFLLAVGKQPAGGPAADTAADTAAEPAAASPVSAAATESGPTSGQAKPAPASRTELPLVAVLGLIATTFSVAGAFYQAYLVREKGWGLEQAKEGLVDSVAGISVLGTITLVIMLTSAIAFYGQNVELKSAADVSRQLKPLFGPYAVILFSAGIFAGSFSSFLVNAMIGGAMLSDGLGLGGGMDAWSTKLFTAAALLVGMLVAVFVPSDDRVGLVVFAQALVVFGFPLLAASILYLATRPDLTGQRRIPLWMKGVAVAGLLVVLLSAGRLAWTLFEKYVIAN
ncbi:MAG: divalent metal cation transporter [Pirellulaceae bacterium]|nr:divalent metal cation transporter [Pirellulaceae bacterium]